MNFFEKKLKPPLEVDRDNLKEVLRCALHQIIFLRKLVLVDPKEMTCDYVDLAYVRCDSVEVQKRVEEGIERIMNAVDKRKDEAVTKFKIVLTFYKEKEVSKLLVFTTLEKVPLERWTIPVFVNHSRAERKRSDPAVQKLKDVLKSIPMNAKEHQWDELDPKFEISFTDWDDNGSIAARYIGPLPLPP